METGRGDLGGGKARLDRSRVRGLRGRRRVRASARADHPGGGQHVVHAVDDEHESRPLRCRLCCPDGIRETAGQFMPDTGDRDRAIGHGSVPECRGQPRMGRGEVCPIRYSKATPFTPGARSSTRASRSPARTPASCASRRPASTRIARSCSSSRARSWSTSAARFLSALQLDAVLQQLFRSSARDPDCSQAQTYS